MRSTSKPHGDVSKDPMPLRSRLSDAMAGLPLSPLVFPIAPIAVIYVVRNLCWHIFSPMWYPPGVDGAEAEPAIAALLIPLLLIVISIILGTLTLIGNRLTRRRRAPLWLMLLLMTPRVLLTALSALFIVLGAGFFIGDIDGFSRHWEVSVAWLLIASSVIALLVQQWRRLGILRAAGAISAA